MRNIIKNLVANQWAMIQTDFDDLNLRCVIVIVPNLSMMVVVDLTNSCYFCTSTMDPI